MSVVSNVKLQPTDLIKPWVNFVKLTRLLGIQGRANIWNEPLGIWAPDTCKYNIAQYIVLYILQWVVWISRNWIFFLKLGVHVLMMCVSPVRRPCMVAESVFEEHVYVFEVLAGSRVDKQRDGKVNQSIPRHWYDVSLLVIAWERRGAAQP